MVTRRTKIDLDPAHLRAVMLVFFVTSILAFIVLELMRWHYRQQIMAAGFFAWGDDGFYVHDIPGQLLAITALHSQGILLVTALVVGLIGFSLCLVAAVLDMHLPLNMLGLASMIFCMVLPVSGVMIYIATRSPACLTIALPQGMLTVTPDDISIPLSDVTQFDSYWVSTGKNGHEVLGVVLNTGEEDGLLSIPSSWHHMSDWEGQHLAGAVQQFVASGGAVFPAS